MSCALTMSMKTYALYREANGQFYATEGLCTHGNAHLADGLVNDTIIECAKHNGRFDFRDGSPQRLPVCMGLKTYPVREEGGKNIGRFTHCGRIWRHQCGTHPNLPRW